MNRIVLITGLAGAGRTTASDALEDMGFFAMENLPSAMIKNVCEEMRETHSDEMSLAVAVDLRDLESIKTLFETRTQLRNEGLVVHIVFLDADEDTIVRRFEQTRRPHPYISSGTLTKAIATERELLSDVLAESDVHIDTTITNPTQLGQQLSKLFREETQGTAVVLNSFGFKYGAPRDADYIFDVRFLPNPFWEPELRELTGLQPEIQEYVRTFDKYDEYLESVKKILLISLEEFSALGKGFVTISIGCTGGFHRSVAVVEDISSWLKQSKYRVILVHRELEDLDSK